MELALLVGHGENSAGGYDPGAVHRGYEEFKIAKEITKYAICKLKTTDCNCQLVNYYGELSLQERINKFKNSSEDLILEIHLNAGAGTGAEVYYYDDNEKGKAYAAKISKDIATAFKIKDRGAKPGKKFGIVRETKPLALLVECCFIDSKDLYLVDTAAEQKLMGETIANSIIDLLGLKQKEDQEQSNKTNTMYQIQCGAFKTLKNAQTLSNKLTQKNVQNYISTSGGYYRVIAGTFKNKTNAESFAKTLKGYGFDSVIKMI